MPFIVQCPHADCRRYMLLEDEDRGTTVNCKLCTKPIRVDASGSHNAPSDSKSAPEPPPRTPPPAPPPQPTAHTPAPPPAAGEDKVLVNCPNPMCKSPLRVATSLRGTNMRCPKCKQVFKA